MPKRRVAEIADVGKLGIDVEDRFGRDEIHEAPARADTALGDCGI